MTNIRLLKEAGVLADRTTRSPNLQFRRFNLIYGFNGSGKTTLSRILASLEEGALHPKLPSDCSFDITLDDGSDFGFPAKPSGLERRLLVFDSDFQEKNLQWATGRANPVFFIGENQADAAAKLAELEAKIPGLTSRKSAAENAERVAERALSTFKRDRAKITAPRLHWGNRKYEAPQLTADYNQWADELGSLLGSEKLSAAEDTCKLEEPMPSLKRITFDARSIGKNCATVAKLCSQRISDVTLDELKRFPDMLLWLKDGYEFHVENSQTSCLFCGNPFSAERRATLGRALDIQIDQFIVTLKNTSTTLHAQISDVALLEQTCPELDAITAELRAELKGKKSILSANVQHAREVLSSFAAHLAMKLSRPATPTDTSNLPDADVISAIVKGLTGAIDAINGLVDQHNKFVTDFASRKEQAGIAIRKHYIAECREDFAAHVKALGDAKDQLNATTQELRRAGDDAADLRSKIRTHGPAANVINKLIASYLGHGELTISPIDRGYEIRRYGTAITGLPSEGEKTAIAISYFLSTIESDGRMLKDLIIVVDDPVSSLDTKALNYACSLLRSRLSGAAQIFILTHNQQCLNEFRKVWKGKAKPTDGKEPTATFLFLDVSIPNGTTKRRASIVEMSKLLREYDSEYHFLFHLVLQFEAAGDNYYDHAYMMPNVMRRVLDVFLAFKCPGNSGLPGKIDQLCKEYPDLDRDKLNALERLSQVESHSDNLDDLISFSSMTIEETKEAVGTLIQMMECVDSKHLAGLRRICH